MSDVRQLFFKYRSYTPFPFLIFMFAYAEPTTHMMIAGGLVVLLGELLRFWGVAYAGALTRVTGNVGAPELVVAGPFAYLRNPLYIGNILMYVGLGIMANALMPWLVLVTAIYFFVQYSLIVSLEEDFLEKTFRAEFADYKKSVPRFFPRLTPYVAAVSTAQKADWKGALRSERRTLQAILLVSIILFVLWYRT